MARRSRQRSALELLLRRHGRFRTVGQLHTELLKEGESTSLSTVYRLLHSMTETGSVDVFHHANGESLYRRCEHQRRHLHLICRNCGQTEEIIDTDIQEQISAAATIRGFSNISKNIDILATCRTCTTSDPHE